MSRVIRSRKVRIGGALVALALALGLSASWLEQRASRRGAGGRSGAEVRSRSDVAEADAQQLGAGPDDRPRRRRARSRVDHPSRQRRRQPGSHRARRRPGRHAARQRMLRPGAAGARVRRRPATSSATGAASRRALRMARVEPRHRRRPQGLRVDRRQRRPRRAHPEVHARRQVRGAVRQGGRAPRSEVAGREAGLHRQQHRHGQLRPRGQDLHRPQGQRGLRRRRLLQPPRRGHRPRQRQDQADAGAPTASRRPTTVLGRYIPGQPPAQQFRNPVHCAEMSVRRHGLRLRPPERPRPGVHKDRQVRQGSTSSRPTRWPTARCGTSPSRRTPRSSSSTWPTASTSTCASSTASR